MIVLENVLKGFHRLQVLRGLSLTVEPGEIVGLIGSNGAGKSTALRIVTGELLPDEGRTSIGGFDLQDNPQEARQCLGYVPQTGGVEPFLTGTEVLEFVAEVRGVTSGSVVNELLERFQLSDAAHRLTREYSDGMVRRLALAAALISDPRALVLDESFNGLDPRGARLMREELIRRRESGTAILLTGHVLASMEQLCTRIAILHGGRIVRTMLPEELGASGMTLEDVYLDATGS